MLRRRVLLRLSLLLQRLLSLSAPEQEGRVPATILAIPPTPTSSISTIPEPACAHVPVRRRGWIQRRPIDGDVRRPLVEPPGRCHYCVQRRCASRHAGLGQRADAPRGRGQRRGDGEAATSAGGATTDSVSPIPVSGPRRRLWWAISCPTRRHGRRHWIYAHESVSGPPRFQSASVVCVLAGGQCKVQRLPADVPIQRLRDPAVGPAAGVCCEYAAVISHRSGEPDGTETGTKLVARCLRRIVDIVLSFLKMPSVQEKVRPVYDGFSDGVGDGLDGLVGGSSYYSYTLRCTISPSFLSSVALSSPAPPQLISYAAEMQNNFASQPVVSQPVKTELRLARLFDCTFYYGIETTRTSLCIS